MTARPTLLDSLLSLWRDPDARVVFQADPDGYAGHYGAQDLSISDVCVSGQDDPREVR